MPAAEWERLSEFEVASKVKECYLKCRTLRRMLVNKRYDQQIIRSVVYQDPDAPPEYPPMLPEYYTTLLMLHTASSATLGSQQDNPLHLHISNLNSFLRAH
jgi:hypothetical protein